MTQMRGWTKPTYTTLAPSVARRVAVEQKIARYTVRALLAAGFTLGVYDGAEITLKHSTDRAAVLNAMNTTDDDYLLVYRVGETERFGWVRFVYGNDGWDVVCDYTTNLDAVMDKVCAYSERFCM